MAKVRANLKPFRAIMAAHNKAASKFTRSEKYQKSGTITKDHAKLISDTSKKLRDTEKTEMGNLKFEHGPHPKNSQKYKDWHAKKAEEHDNASMDVHDYDKYGNGGPREALGSKKLWRLSNKHSDLNQRHGEAAGL